MDSYQVYAFVHGEERMLIGAMSLQEAIEQAFKNSDSKQHVPIFHIPFSNPEWKNLRYPNMGSIH
jgi:hypothetical protein